MISVVCEAVAASGEPTRSRSRKTFPKEPEPNPQTGRCTNIDKPPRTSFARPLEEVFSDCLLLRCRELWPAATAIPTTTAHAASP